jgi:hypothetical protein
MMFSANCFEIHPGRQKAHVCVVGRKNSAALGISKIFTSVLSHNKAQKMPLFRQILNRPNDEITGFAGLCLAWNT